MEQERNFLGIETASLPKLVANIVHLGTEHPLDSKQFWDFLDLLPVAVMISRDRACTRIDGNIASRVLLRVPPGQNLSRSAPMAERPPFQIYVEGKLVSISELPMQKAAMSGQTVYRSECELRFQDGSNVFLAGHSVPLFDSKGEVCGSLGAFVDITHIKRLEEQNRLLSRELSHRIKNIVSMVLAISNRTIRDVLPEDAYTSYVSRLSVLARAHDLLYSRGSTLTDVEGVVKAALKPLLQLEQGQMEISGPALQLDASGVLAVAIIVNELATNAVKYGALCSASGRVDLSWTRTPKDKGTIATFVWQERDGCAIAPPEKLGTGAEMIRTFSRGSAKITYDQTGVRCSFEVPLEEPWERSSN